jgi:Asp-tRNA(Asn)/Glu-tRNA(Gln) amidotransferase B subunit
MHVYLDLIQMQASAMLLVSKSSDELDVNSLCTVAIALSWSVGLETDIKVMLNKILGRVMKDSRGRVNSTEVKECLIDLLEQGGAQ